MQERLGLIPVSGRSLEKGMGIMPGEFHEQRNLVGCSLWVCKESHVTEQLTQTVHTNKPPWLYSYSFSRDFLFPFLQLDNFNWLVKINSGVTAHTGPPEVRFYDFSMQSTYILYTYVFYWRLLLLFSRSVMSDSLWSHGLHTPGFPVLHYLPFIAQTHVHWVDDAIQPSHPLSSPFPPALNLS